MSRSRESRPRGSRKQQKKFTVAVWLPASQRSKPSVKSVCELVHSVVFEPTASQGHMAAFLIG